MYLSRLHTSSSPALTKPKPSRYLQASPPGTDVVSRSSPDSPAPLAKADPTYEYDGCIRSNYHSAAAADVYYLVLQRHIEVRIIQLHTLFTSLAKNSSPPPSLHAKKQNKNISILRSYSSTTTDSRNPPTRSYPTIHTTPPVPPK